jgi:hypothetical protein
MVSLSQEIERPLEQVLTVNSVTEISTYCTSIVARTLEGGISHVRNLDFGATALMTKLVYEQVLVRDGLEKATAPSIAGYYGAYTGQVPGQWSVSYNVRETVVYPTEDVLQANLQRTLDPDYVELWVLI